MTPEQMQEYRLELLRQRVKVDADISRSLSELICLIKAIVEQSPWGMQVLSQFRRERYGEVDEPRERIDR